ncbi:MAG: excinuclease ABC subunit UvrC [Peptoniphilus sp.]|nr:excinuclease ABC subunit UvrC [Peptoniphilus sp.]MDD7363697.1 excinuclease ABC subunit UvrC [Bacillota bacterium]MDY6044082.1 excinuclease ABC subunit UvrC [Peptoniphilus sp.]
MSQVDLREKLKSLPDDPGVYLMKNKLDQIIYVGKAKNLKKRVRQYFGSYGRGDKKVRSMVSHICDFEYIIVNNELESLILESNLIKEYLPKYNILLRDDKQYPYIKITNEPFPRVLKTRRIQKDRSKYYGPFPDVLAVNQTIDILHELFPLRNCKLDLSKPNPVVRPCLNYHINRCSGPCIGAISEREYGKYIEEIERFLEGRPVPFISTLEEKMKEASKALEFEKAADYRDKLQALYTLLEKQRITAAGSDEEFDVIGLASDDKEACIQIFFFRQGKNMGREHFFIDNAFDDEPKEIMQAFITQFYHGTAYIPGKLYIHEFLDDKELVEEMLSEKRGSKVQVLVPKIGEKKQIMSMVRRNAIDMLSKYSDQMRTKLQKQEKTVESLQKLLGLSKVPKRIEAYDISNISGAESVGSMVVFEDGEPKKTDYRRFRIKEVQGPDDYASLREVLSRRFKRGLNERAGIGENRGFAQFPDLILMDGGKGQVTQALTILNELGLSIPVAGLVKDDEHKTRGIYLDKEEIRVPKQSAVYRLMYQIQDEAHRFAITYHRSLRAKAGFKSELDGIAGIGPKRKKELMKAFKSITKIKEADVETLSRIEGMNYRAAENLYRHFHGGEHE